jgi:hypothetical protein
MIIMIFFKGYLDYSLFLCKMSDVSPYSIAKELILAGKLKSLEELTLILKKTNLAADMPTSPKRLNRLLDNPGLFTIEDAYTIAALIGVSGKQVLDVLNAEYLAKKKK